MSSTNRRFRGLLVGLALLIAAGAPGPAEAKFIRLSTSTQSTILRDIREVHVQFLVTNEGDEPAYNVALEFPDLKRQFTIAADLMPGESITHTVEMTYADFGMELPGRYVLPFRLAYKDQNLFPFSAPAAVELVLDTEPPRMLTMGFLGVAGALHVDLKDSAHTVLQITNSSPEPLRVDEIRVNSPTELNAQLGAPTTPFTLQPGEKTSVDLDLERTVGQLQGSSYGGNILVSGVSGNLHFVESVSFVTNIIGEPVRAHHASRIALIALALIVVLGWVLQRRQRKS